MEFAMIGFPPPHRTCETLHIFDISLYIYIFIYIHIYVHLWLTRETRQFQINKDPKDAIFHCLCLSGIDSPLARVPSVKDGTGNGFFLETPGDTKNCTLTDGYQLLCGFQRNFCFYLFTSSFLRLHQPTRDRSLKFWNLPPLKHHILCVLTTSKGTSIHSFDR